MSKKFGFTLIELLVVITIIAIMVTVGLTLYTNAQKQARDTKRRADLNAIAKALEQYKAANGTYPTFCESGNTWSSHTCWTASGFGLIGYINEMPKDPQNIDLGDCANQDNCHIYRYCSDGIYFIVGVNLEGSSSQGAPSNCALGGPNRFWIPNQQ